jgi:hypothetical protein
MAGSSSSNLCIYGGTTSSYKVFSTISSNTLTHNGLSWTARANMNTARANMGSSSQGGQSSALATSGITDGSNANTFGLTNTTEAFGN